MRAGDGRAVRLVVIGAVGVAAIGAAVAVSTYRNRERSSATPPKAAVETAMPRGTKLVLSGRWFSPI